MWGNLVTLFKPAQTVHLFEGVLEEILVSYDAFEEDLVKLFVAEESVDETNLYYSKLSMNKSCCF